MRTIIALAIAFIAAAAQAAPVPQSCQDVQAAAYACNAAMIDARALINGDLTPEQRAARFYYNRESAKEKRDVIVAMIGTRGVAAADKACKREAQRMYWDREYQQAVETTLAQAVIIDPARAEGRADCEAALKAIQTYRW